MPSNIIDSRISDNGGVEYLVEWMDGNHFLFIQISFLRLIFVLKDTKKVGSVNLMFQMILLETTMTASNLQTVRKYFARANEMNS